MFPTEQQAYHRLRWDPRFDVRRCHVVISLRPSGTQRLPFLELDTGVVPWHRIVELWVGDELAWSRPRRVDRLDELAARAPRAPRAAADAAAAAAAPARPLTGAPTPPHRFDARAGRWIEGAIAPPPRPAALRVAAWNLLHDRHAIDLGATTAPVPDDTGATDAESGDPEARSTSRARGSADAGDAAPTSADDTSRADAERPGAQTAAERRWRDALDRLAALDVDLIVLAEVTPRMWELILAQPWIRARFAAVPGPGPSARALSPFGQALLSRHPLQDAAIAPLLRRSALLATVAAGPLTLGVAALHLTSSRVDGAAALRDAQLAAVAGHARAVPHDGWLLAGDFNADPEDHAAHVDALGAIDPWPALRGDEPGYTFDVEQNPLAAAASVRGRSARFDRVLAIGPALRPTAVRLFGLEPGPGGVHPSDHFGVLATFALDAPAPAAPPRPSAAAAAPPASALAHAPASRRTALALIPPLEAWGALQRVRCAHDRGFARWPPHVTLCHPFLDEAWLEQATRELAPIAAAAAPFELVLDRADAIDARGETIVLFPDRRSARAVQRLREALLRPLAALHSPRASLPDEARDFRPHLTIARLARGQRRPELPPQRWRVDHVAILRESEAGRFEPVHVLPLGGDRRAAAAAGPRATATTVALAPASSTTPASAPPSLSPAAARAVARVRHALAAITTGAADDEAGAAPSSSDDAAAAAAEPTVEPFGSAVYAPDHAADVDLLVRAPAALAPALARALGLRELGTEPPRLRGALDGAPVDLMLVPPGAPDDDRARGLLAGPRDAALLAEHLRHHGRHAAFAAAWPAVRRFAAARAMAAQGLGWIGSFAWALLLAIPLVHDEALCAAAPGRVLPAWLRWLGALRPGARLGLDATRTGDPAPLWLAAPAPPSRNAARGLTAGTAALWFDEARRAARRAARATTDEAALAAAALDLAADPPPGATLTVALATEAARGRYDRRFRGLLLDLERALGAAGPVRPWGRFDAGPAPATWLHRTTVPAAREADARDVVTEWLDREFGDLDHPVLR